jgi:hypothetical protein
MHRQAVCLFLLSYSNPTDGSQHIFAHTDQSCGYHDLHRASRTVTSETSSIDGSAIPDLRSAAIFDGDGAFDVREDVEKVLVGEFHFALEGHGADNVTPCNV